MLVLAFLRIEAIIALKDCMTVGPGRSVLRGELPLEAETLQRERSWIESLRAESEREGVLSGDPDEELESADYSLREGVVMELVPGYAFWRTRVDTTHQTTSRPYQTASPMKIASYRFHKDSRGEVWIYFRSPVVESSYENAHVRLERLETGEHRISIKNIEEPPERE